MRNYKHAVASALLVLSSMVAPAMSQTRAVETNDPLCAEAAAAYAKQDFRAAYILYKKHIAILTKSEGAEGLNVGRMYDNLGLCLKHLNMPDETEQALKLSVKILTPHKTDEPWSLGKALADLGEWHRSNGKNDTALFELREATELLSEAGGTGVDLRRALYSLGLIHAKMGQLSESINMYKRALAIRTDDDEPSSQLEKGKLSFLIGKTYRRMKEPKSAQDYYIRAIAFFRSDELANYGYLAEATDELANAYLEGGEQEQAKQTLESFVSESKKTGQGDGKPCRYMQSELDKLRLGSD